MTSRYGMAAAAGDGSIPGSPAAPLGWIKTGTCRSSKGP